MTTDNEQNEIREQLRNDRSCDVVVQFLVYGLMSRRQLVRDRCAEVLTAMGTDVADRLNQILGTGDLSNTHWKRVKVVLASATAAGTPSPHANMLLLNSILFMIEQNDMEVVKRGLALSRFLPPRALTDFLVDAALQHKSNGAYFDRLLQAVEIVKEAPSKEQCNGLVEICYNESGLIQRSCKRLLKKIDRGEIGDRSWAGGFQQHHLTAEEMNRWPESATPIDPFPELSDPKLQNGYHFEKSQSNA